MNDPEKMKDKLKRRTFISSMLAGIGSGLALVVPAGAVFTACTSDSSGRGKTRTAEMILIPEGNFLMGTTAEQVAALATEYGYHESWIAHEAPRQEISLPAYMIDQYPVTNRQYAEFCKATGHPPRKHWRSEAPPAEILDHPVTGVSHGDALAYAEWIGKRLPTEAEWEKAARGTDGSLFPWGDEFNPGACCWNRTGAGGLTTAPVGTYPEGASPYGVMDMAGNTFEWCGDGPSPNNAFIKGGSWMTTEIIDLRPAARGNSGRTNNASTFYGFRCVKEV